MCHKISLCVGLGLIVVGSLLAGSASAAPINPSFETNVLTDGTKTSPVTGWTTGNGVPKVWNPTESSYYNAAGNGTPLGADGANVADLSVSGHGWTSLYQTLPDVTIVKDTTYTMTVAVGYALDIVPTEGYMLQLYSLTGETWVKLAEFSRLTTDTLVAGEFLDKSLSFKATAADAGKSLVVYLEANTNTLNQDAGATNFDNVRVSVSSVPEPSSLILVGLGLLAYAWRKRK